MKNIKIYKKPLLNVLFLSIFGTFCFQNYAIAASKNNSDNKIDENVFLKPERIELINKLAEEKLKNEEYPVVTPEAKNIVENIKNEEDFISKNSSNIEKKYQNINIDFSPTEKFEKIMVAPNFSTTIIFVDKNSNPWNIDKYTLGGAEYYYPELQFPHILTISPKAMQGASNLTVFLKDDLHRPLSFDIVINNKTVDYINVIKVNELGNNSPKEIIFNGSSIKESQNSLSHLSKMDDDFMSLMLAGNKPSGFNEMYLFNSQEEKYEEPEDFRVFHKDNEKYLYIRTKHITYSPEHEGISYSADRKYKVIKLPYTTSFYVVINGNLRLVKLKAR